MCNLLLTQKDGVTPPQKKKRFLEQVRTVAGGDFGGTKIVGVKQMVRSKMFWGQQICGVNKCWGQNKFWGQQKHLGKQKLGATCFGGHKWSGREHRILLELNWLEQTYEELSPAHVNHSECLFMPIRPTNGVVDMLRSIKHKVLKVKCNDLIPNICEQFSNNEMSLVLCYSR